MSNFELLVKYLNFSFHEACRFWVQRGEKASRCMLDYSVPICCGNWCEEIGHGLYVVVCDKLKEIARSLPFAIQTGIYDVDLMLKGGLTPPSHVALLGDSKGVERVLERLISDALNKGYLCFQMVLGEPRVKVELGNVLLGDLGALYEAYPDKHLQVEEVLKLERSSVEKGFQGLFIVFDVSSYLKSRKNARSLKPLLFEEQVGKAKLKRTISLCMYYNGNVFNEVSKRFVIENHNIILHVKDPLIVSVVKIGQLDNRMLSITR